jgi:hypothetical protein
VPTLAETLRFDEPSTDWLKAIGPYSQTLANFLWNSLTIETRKTYAGYVKSWVSFCNLHGQQPFPAQLHSLGEWILLRGVGGGLGQRIAQADSIRAMLSV